MKKLQQWLKNVFEPEEYNDLDVTSIAEALNDSSIRHRWFLDVLEEIRRINIEVDKRLLSGPEYGLTDLCARRKAIQYVLEAVLSVKRQVKQEVRPNPQVQIVNLDRVTA